jgi:hypothetical protein
VGVSKMRTTPLQPQSDGMVQRYIKTVEEHLRKVVASHQKDWDSGLPNFVLAYRASTKDITGLTPANLVFGRELRLPCNLLFGAPPQQGTTHNRSRGTFSGPSTWHTHLWSPTPEAGQWLNENSSLHADQLRGHHDGDEVWFYRPTCTQGEIA